MTVGFASVYEVILANVSRVSAAAGPHETDRNHGSFCPAVVNKFPLGQDSTMNQHS